MKDLEQLDQKFHSYLDYEEALTAIERALLIEPNNSVWRFQRAKTLYYLAQYRQAVAACNEALFLNPKNVWLLYIKSLALRKLNRNNEALMECQKALRLDPKFNPASVLHQQMTGQLYHFAPEEKITTLDILLEAFQAILVGPTKTENLLRKTDHLFNLAETEGDETQSNKLLTAALTGYRRVLAIEPRLYSAWHKLSLTAGQLKRRDEAGDAFLTTKYLQNQSESKQVKSPRLFSSQFTVSDFLEKISYSEEEIFFPSVEMNPEGMNFLVENLKLRTACKKLYFFNSKIDELGLSLFVESLEFNNNLTHLYFKIKGLSDAVITKLAMILKKNNRLTHLHISHLSSNGAKALLETLQENKSLIEVSVPESIDFVVRLQIEEYCEKNRVILGGENGTEFKQKGAHFSKKIQSCTIPIPLSITTFNKNRILPSLNPFKRENQFIKDAHRRNIWVGLEPLGPEFSEKLKEYHSKLDEYGIKKEPDEKILAGCIKKMIQNNENIFAILNQRLTIPITEQLFCYFHQDLLYTCANILTNCARYNQNKEDVIVKPGNLAMNISQCRLEKKPQIEFTVIAEDFYYTNLDSDSLTNVPLFSGSMVMTQFKKNPHKEELSLQVYTNRIELVKEILIAFCHNRKQALLVPDPKSEDFKSFSPSRSQWTTFNNHRSKNKNDKSANLLKVYEWALELPKRQDFINLLQKMLNLPLDTTEIDHFFCELYNSAQGNAISITPPLGQNLS